MSSRQKLSNELSEIVTALKQLSGESITERTQDKSKQSYFCVEDLIPAEDLKINVEVVGELKYPIENKTIQKLLQVSSKAKYGKGETTVLDTNFRDTQVIPADKLMVKIEESALAEVLERMAHGLNIGKESTLSIHLHNLLIYGPGQFFKKHRDSEKLPNMVATLVIVLPTQHKGGDLIIEHGDREHVFFGSKKSVKCIAFYADCYHKIEKVTEGYRIALTYNVVLKSSTLNTVKISESLEAAVSNYFHGTENRLLVYLLNHMYSEHGLRWHMLKGNDRTRAQALLAVAKKQGRLPFLALAKYHVQTDAECTDYEEVDTSLYFWINQSNVKVQMGQSKNVYRHSEGVDVSEDEICYTIKTEKMCDPYETEDGGPTGNEGHPIEHWYRRACVAIWADKWSFSDDFQNSLAELQDLMNQSCDKSIIEHEIITNSNGFYNTEFWKDESVVDTLLNIVKYLGITEETLQILMKLSPKEVLKADRASFIPWIENLNDLSSWTKILTAWSSNFSAKDLFDAIIPFMKKKITGESNVAYHLMQQIIHHIPNMNMSKYSYYSNYSNRNDSSYFSYFCDLLQICNSLKDENLEKRLILTESFKKILKDLKNFIELEKILTLEQFKRVYLALKLDIKEDLLAKIDIGSSWHSSQGEKSSILQVCNFYQICIKLGDNSTGAVLLEKIKNSASFVKDINDYISLIQSIPSAISEGVFKNVIDNFIKTFNNDVTKLCTMFKICISYNFQSSEMHLKKYISSQKAIFTASSTANLIMKLKKTLTVGQFNRFNDLKDYAIKFINDELAEYESIKIRSEQIRLSCSCENCRRVENFLKARNVKTLSIKDLVKNRNHVEKEINKIPYHIRQHVKMETIRSGSPQTLQITQPQTDDALINQLCEYKNKLLNISSSVESCGSVTNKRKRLE